MTDEANSEPTNAARVGFATANARWLASSLCREMSSGAGGIGGLMGDGSLGWIYLGLGAFCFETFGHGNEWIGHPQLGWFGLDFFSAFG